jgi:hypothetical protein
LKPNGADTTKIDRNRDEKLNEINGSKSKYTKEKLRKESASLIESVCNEFEFEELSCDHLRSAEIR